VSLKRVNSGSYADHSPYRKQSKRKASTSPEFQEVENSQSTQKKVRFENDPISPPITPDTVVKSIRTLRRTRSTTLLHITNDEEPYLEAPPASPLLAIQSSVPTRTVAENKGFSPPLPEISFESFPAPTLRRSLRIYAKQQSHEQSLNCSQQSITYSQEMYIAFASTSI
jgi:hypothetical protein